MMARYAARELLDHPARSALAVAGVAVACAMLLDMLMLGAGLGVSFESLLTGAGYELRAAPGGTLPLDTDATIPQAARRRAALAAHPDVRGVAPVLAANLAAAGEGDDRRFALGVDPSEQGLYRIAGGRELAGRGEVVVDAEQARAGVVPGDTLWLAAGGGFGAVAGAAARPFRVVGVGDFFYASAGERAVALPREDVEALTGRADRVSFFMLRVAEEADPGVVAAELRDLLPALEIASVTELVERAETRLSYFRQLAFILGTVSLIVTALLVGTIMAISINERYGMLAALRAIGISRRSILGGLGAESLLLCLTAALLGIGLGLVTADQLERILADFPGLPAAIRFFVFRPGQVATAVAALLAVGTAAALVPAWRATRLPIATTLHREEP